MCLFENAVFDVYTAHSCSKYYSRILRIVFLIYLQRQSSDLINSLGALLPIQCVLHVFAETVFANTMFPACINSELIGLYGLCPACICRDRF